MFLVFSRASSAVLIKQMENKANLEELTDRMHENMPTYLNPVSYSRQGCRTSIIDKKCEQIQKVWDRIARSGRQLNTSKGIRQVQGSSPVN